jgi:gamma-glutamylcyclotransferase (GGCT)/AIG2-like uncharacterized protein YtfP
VSASAVQVFVYGTLKRGLRNYPAMQGAGVSRVQNAFLKGFVLYHVPNFERPYPYPCLVAGRGTVMGELHTLGASELEPEDALRVLDHLELEGLEYRRVQTWVRCRGRLERAWVYVYLSKRLVHRVRANRVRKLAWVPRS